MTTTRLRPPVTLPTQRRFRRSFKTSGTLTVPTDVYLLELLLVSGGGGGGGGYNAANAVGGGGGSGWPVRCQLPVTPGDVVAITVGAGGIGGAGLAGSGAGSPGGNGGDTIVTVNGVEVIRIPGGGGGGGANASGNTQANFGRPSWGHYGAYGQDSGAPYGGGAGAGYSSGISGPNLWPSIAQYLQQGISGFDRIRGGRRPMDMWSTNYTRVAAMNGWLPSVAIQQTTAATDYNLIIPERFLTICWGGSIRGDGAATPAAEPPNTGHGGTGSGGRTTVADNTGANGGSGFALIEWDAAA